MISCQNCSAANPDDGRYCEACGGPLSRCPACDAANRAKAAFCSRCGNKLAARGPAAPSSPPAQALTATRQKWITVLFADISGSTELIGRMDAEAAMRRLEPATKAMRDAVVACGGLVNLQQGDGIMALFGVPIACEDHALRACRAALTMIDAIEGLNDPAIAIRVGLDSGKLVVRQTGQDASDYDAIGPVAHVASRLEHQAAPGTVLISGRVAELARGHVEVDRLGPTMLRGIAEPLHVARLLGVAARPRWDARSAVSLLTPFIDRETERALLRTAAQQAYEGRGQAVTIVAEAGLGKSRLIHEFLQTLETSGRTILRAAGLPDGAGVPYAAAASLLRSWLNVEAGDSRIRMTRVLDGRLAAAKLERWRAPLRSVLGLPEEDEQWAKLSPPDRRNRITAAFRAVIEDAAAANELVIVLDDFQWVDGPSALCVETLIGSVDRLKLLLIVATRPDARPPWVDDPVARLLNLAPLRKIDADTLLRNVIGALDRWSSLRRRIVEQAEGVPLYLEEISRSFAEDEHGLSQVDAKSLLDQAVFEVPGTVQAIISARIDRLPPSRREVLEICSVIGRLVPFDAVRAATSLPDTELRADLAALERDGFLSETANVAGLVYAFNHAMTQAVVYEGMLTTRRREFHLLVLAEMQARAPDRLDETVELRANHAFCGEQWPLAVRLAIEAGDRAASRWAWREAVRFYERAITAAQHLPRTPQTDQLAIDARLRLRIALPVVGDLPRIRRCLDEARELAVGLGSKSGQIAGIDVSRCLTLTKLGSLHAAIEAGNQARQVAVTVGDPALCLTANFALAQAHWYHGDFATGEALLHERLDDARDRLRSQETGTTGTASVLTLVCLAKTQAITGRHVLAAAAAEDAREIAELTRKPFDRSYAQVGIGFSHLMKGDASAAIAALETGLQIARDHDIALLVPSSLRYLGRSYVEVGRFKDARVVIDEAIDLTAACRLLGMRIWSMLARGMLEIAEAKAASAETTLRSVLDLAQANGFRPAEAQAMQLLGRLATLVGKPERDPAANATWYIRALQIADALAMAPQAASIRRDLQAFKIAEKL